MPLGTPVAVPEIVTAPAATTLISPPEAVWLLIVAALSMLKLPTVNTRSPPDPMNELEKMEPPLSMINEGVDNVSRPPLPRSSACV